VRCCHRSRSTARIADKRRIHPSGRSIENSAA
jgi:hypothetical protein